MTTSNSTKSWLVFWAAIGLLITSKIVSVTDIGLNNFVISLVKSSLMSVPFVWVTGIFIHREIRLGWYLSWRLIEVLILILMATAMTLMPYVNVTFKLSTSAVLALTIAYCGVMLLSIGGRTAMVCYMKVEGRRFFRPLVPDKVSGFSDYIAVVFLSLVIFSYLVLKHSA